MDVRVKLGESMLNSGRLIRLFEGRTRFTQLLAVFNCICSRPETAGDVISGWLVGRLSAINR